MRLPMLSPLHSHNICGVVVELIEIFVVADSARAFFINAICEIVIVCQMVSRNPFILFRLIDKDVAFAVKAIGFF